MRVLFVASECFPLVKTGGLGDVLFSLPHALKSRGADVCLLLPGYRDLLTKLECVEILDWLSIQGAGRSHAVRLLKAMHPDFDFPLLIADCQLLYDRPGNPYLHPDGYDWPDNAERYTVFSRIAAKLSLGQTKFDWRADIVHSHDWQTGMVPAFLSMEPDRPSTVFTIHNLAYGGHFSHDEFMQLQVPGHWWSGDGVEFYGGFSMLKAGLVYADAITTVSPTYAEEICTPAFGHGMEGVLQANRHKLTGILNGIDAEIWSPETDTYLQANYSVRRRNPGKRINKQALLDYFGAETDDDVLDAPLFGLVSRLVEQKGVDLIVTAIPSLIEASNARFVLVGAGTPHIEKHLLELTEKFPQRVHVYIGYSEKLAHLVEAGSDVFLMPSRFEPCGLNQMYSLRYGTPPIVHKTGGLADTVVDTTSETLKSGKATGFVMQQPTVDALLEATDRAIEHFNKKNAWNCLMRTGMQLDFGWEKSAMAYFMLYEKLGGQAPHGHQ